MACPPAAPVRPPRSSYVALTNVGYPCPMSWIWSSHIRWHIRFAPRLRIKSSAVSRLMGAMFLSFSPCPRCAGSNRPARNVYTTTKSGFEVGCFRAFLWTYDASFAPPFGASVPGGPPNDPPPNDAESRNAPPERNGWEPPYGDERDPPCGMPWAPARPGPGGPHRASPRTDVCAKFDPPAPRACTRYPPPIGLGAPYSRGTPAPPPMGERPIPWFPNPWLPGGAPARMPPAMPPAIRLALAAPAPAFRFLRASAPRPPAEDFCGYGCALLRFGLGGGMCSPVPFFCTLRKYFCAWLRI
mmetsp:Transcript_14237/g.60940  ORF Transcript_14237/g.60940 Transcript_14237/m.60940 type:complete len:299 (-) Transcript_14237:566-1462(-)